MEEGPGATTITSPLRWGRDRAGVLKRPKSQCHMHMVRWRFNASYACGIEYLHAHDQRKHGNVMKLCIDSLRQGGLSRLLS